jgi:hypothetical protein
MALISTSSVATVICDEETVFLLAEVGVWMGKRVLVRTAKFYGHIETNYQERHQIPLSLTC